MPWKIIKRDEQFCVVKESDGKTVKCHPTREKAKSHLAALYVNEPSSSKKSFNTGYGLLKSLITERVEELKGCGANKPGGGGFSAGNTCARGGGGTAAGPDNPTVSSVRAALTAKPHFISVGSASSTGFTTQKGATVKKNETTGFIEVGHVTGSGLSQMQRKVDSITSLRKYDKILKDKGYNTEQKLFDRKIIVKPKVAEE